MTGCEEQHLLQATRVALIPQNAINDANQGFVRTGAYLFIVLITDQDGCSASDDNKRNDDIFNLVTKTDPGDTVTRRCAARGHLCGGQPIPEYAPAVGYTRRRSYSSPLNRGMVVLGAISPSSNRICKCPVDGCFVYSRLGVTACPLA